jgi:Transposase DDE domain
VNAERLHSLALLVKEELDATAPRVDHLREVTRQSANNPGDPDSQRALIASRDELFKVLDQAPSQDLPPIQREELKELDLSEVLAVRLRKRVEAIFRRNTITLAEAADQLDALLTEIQETNGAVGGLISGFDRLGVGADKLGAGEVELSLLVPRAAVGDGLEALGGEFIKLKGILDPFIDLVTVSRTGFGSECARSRETVKRGGASSLAEALTDAADYGYCASHSRFFFGFRLHALFAPDGTPRALALTSPKIDERLVCVQLVARCERQPGQTLILIGDKNFRGKDFEAELATLDAVIMRPRRKDEPGHGPHLAPIRQRIESIFWTCKDLLTLERHGARTLRNLRARLCARFAALAATVALNHQLGRPSRSLANYTA